jgi:N-acetylglucosaminyldiphosphoundecaprenol N-acetyl-beta-D-mannosaminyltransferase
MVCPTEVGFDRARRQSSVVLGFPVLSGKREEILDELWGRLERREPTHVVTLNPEMIELASRQPAVREVLGRADVCVADGVGLEWAAHKLGQPDVVRYPGIELAFDLLSRLAARTGSVYLLGGKPGVAQAAAERLSRELAGLRIAGVADGYFEAGAESQRSANIKAARPDLLLVGMGCPKQELFIANHRAEMGVPLLIGVGGALEVFAGLKPRAPRWIRQSGFEWAYRTLQDVSRLKRLGILPRFTFRVLAQALRNKRD